MLRIKKEINLKELEKFGFNLNDKGQYEKKYTIICKNKNIMGKGGTMAHSKVHLAEELFDLIQARISRESGGIIWR